MIPKLDSKKERGELQPLLFGEELHTFITGEELHTCLGEITHEFLNRGGIAEIPK